ncbi:hypothetical protein AT251_15430 [Enterovibrio nigricans]|nr:hypothetical protein AT251_15430 [Enterovibrio nigricans]
MSIKKHIHGITFEPRLGVNRSYALASEASINATQGEENAYLKFNPSNYNSTSYYIDSEIYKKFNLSEITNKISVKPKLWFRYDSIDGENYGNELEIKFSISSQYNNFSLLYSIKESDAYTSKSIKIRLSRELHSGQLSLINSFNKNGNANINLSYTSNF